MIIASGIALTWTLIAAASALISARRINVLDKNLSKLIQIRGIKVDLSGNRLNRIKQRCDALASGESKEIYAKAEGFDRIARIRFRIAVLVLVVTCVITSLIGRF